MSILTAVTKDDSGAGRDVTREAVMRCLGRDAERGADVGVREVVTEAVGADQLVDGRSDDETGACDEQRPITGYPRRERAPGSRARLRATLRVRDEGRRRAGRA